MRHHTHSTFPTSTVLHAISNILGGAAIEHDTNDELLRERVRAVLWQKAELQARPEDELWGVRPSTSQQDGPQHGYAGRRGHRNIQFRQHQRQLICLEP